MPKVFIDAGHGGKDSGATDGTANDPINTRESDIALDCATKLIAALQRCGITTGGSRAGDTYPTLQQRVDSANAFGADIFVSWHFNAFTDGSSARGIEVLYYPTSIKGKILAAVVYDSLTAVTPWADRGLKPRDNLYVLHYTKMPAIIIEAGFITNTEEEALTADPVYRTALSEAAARGICAYLGMTYVGVATPAPIVTPVVTVGPVTQPVVEVPVEAPVTPPKTLKVIEATDTRIVIELV